MHIDIKQVIRNQNLLNVDKDWKVIELMLHIFKFFNKTNNYTIKTLTQC